MRWLPLLVLCACTFVRSAAGPEVVDGDTFRIQVDGRTERVRLIGIDAPEHDQCFAAESTRRLEELLGSGLIELESDASERDRFGRLLRYARNGEVFVNLELVRGGFAEARAYPPDVAYQSLLEEAESKAREDRAGMWSCPVSGEGAATGSSP